MVTIHPRSSWGGGAHRELTGTTTWKPWEGGVAIHHRGGGSFQPADESECQAEILHVFNQNIDPPWYRFDLEKYDDVQYNFFVCPHGKIYEGRGTGRRSAANGNATLPLTDLGANTCFYAICGLLKADDHPTSAMRSSIRSLIRHLRDLPRNNAGDWIVGHRDFGTSQDCPGKLLPYVDDGSLEPSPTTQDPREDVQVIDRNQWGARPPVDRRFVPWSERRGFTVHYSAGPSSQTPRAIQNYHMDSRGWWDIGYNFLVDTYGRVYVGRGFDVEGSHATSYNRSHIGMCFIGGNGQATPAAKRAFVAVYLEACSRAGRMLSKTFHGGLAGHATACPGADLRGWVQAGMPISGSGHYYQEPSGGSSSGGATAVRSVTSQQRAVNGLGYRPPLEVDGSFGPLTQAGVRWLQNKVGTAADGIWGPLTEAAYQAYTSGGGDGGLTTIRTVTSQQRAVNGLGHSPPLDVDGSFGPLTQAGVRWLQNKVGAAADGLWGPATEAAYQAYTGGVQGGDGGLTTIRSVAYQQRAVNGLGYRPPLEVDGSFGPLTEAGVRWLQNKVGADPDGFWGPATEAAYGRYTDGGAWLTVDGDFGPATISALQRAIGVPVDGSWGPESRRGLQRHLNRWADAGLVVDGDIGPASVRALQRHLNAMVKAGLTVDGDWGQGTTKALQTALNRGSF
jgi:peptidoglycan hydrolase-like protein with peptidoglycan-binding domain